MKKNNYITKLQKKCNLSEEFINNIYLFFEKLLSFSYITTFDINKLAKRLYNNIDLVIINDKSNIMDYKSGYYDAVKKELYIKNISDKSAIFHRLLYVLTTKSKDDNEFTTGYSKSMKSKQGYNMEYMYYGLNRAIISNLTCRLLYTLPQSLSLIPTYRSYNNNFLGYDFSADNDIYFVEGKLLRQICLVYNLNEESLYTNLFNDKFLKFNILEKDDLEKTLLVLDLISIDYSHYNKLCYYNKLLSDLYIKKKKVDIKNDKKIKEFTNKETKLQRTIKTIVNKLSTTDITEEDIKETSLNECLDNLEEKILLNISLIQTELIKYIISKKSTFDNVDYVKHLKELNDILIVKNDDLKNEMYNTIFNDIIHIDENTCTNLVSKIKYSLANYMLGKEKYIHLYKDVSFNIIESINNDDTDICILISSGIFNEIAYIKNLNNAMHTLEDNINFIESKNLKYLLNTNITKANEIETLFTALKDSDDKYKNITIHDVYIYIAGNDNLLLVNSEFGTDILLVKTTKESVTFELLPLSETYSLINNGSNLPVLYKKSKILSFFKFFKIQTN